MQLVERFLRINTHAEQEASRLPFRIVYLDGLEGPELSGLRDKVRRNNGAIEILVHPYYEDGKTTLAPSFELRESYKEERNEFIQRVLEKDIPLVIFEEEDSLKDLSEKIDSNVGTVYVVPTLQKEATPSSIKRSHEYHPVLMNSRVAHGLRFEAWEKVTEPLRKAGVKKAIVGGEYMLLVQPQGDNERILFDQFSSLAKGKKGAMELVSAGLFPSACPGQVANRLLGIGIDISISSISSPTNKIEPTKFTSKQ